ncbi:hypothetical protein [Azohydromonas caseinilytica]|uniref:Uncharacterized protein n=1 Tax=Azohydromonas caseinilytica TaxID=2728836 RepID=A0A848FH44_9BURK|nr:hypothetical protein [Azohydromonas caseinilytica]NML18582.1 hypothetical protein [Azohydromonas caseinilytica]
MRRIVFALPWLLAAGATPAQEGNALHAAECRGALAALQAQESSALAGPRPDEAAQRAALVRLNAARDRAARACLQGRPDQPALPGRLAQPPLSVPPPVALTPQPAPLPPPPTGIPVPPPRPAPPSAITSCDVAGCWANDGTRLQRIGPNQLLGPRGFCTASGALLNCP